MAQDEGLESRGKKIILINREIFAFSGQQSQHRLECWLLKLKVCRQQKA